MQTKYLILGMLHLIDQMTKRKIFCVSTASVVMHETPIGHIEVFTTGARSQGLPSMQDASVKNTTLRDARSRILTSPRKITDPGDSDYAIMYERKAVPMSPVNFLSTVLYAMATAAQGGNEEHCGDLAGFNEKRSTVFRVHGIRPTMSRNRLTYEKVRRGLRLLTAAMYDEGAIGEVHFQILYQEELLGGGSIELSDY